MAKTKIQKYAPGPLVRDVKTLIGLLDRKVNFFFLEGPKERVRVVFRDNKQTGNRPFSELRLRIWGERLREAVLNPKHPAFNTALKRKGLWHPALLKTR